MSRRFLCFLVVGMVLTSTAQADESYRLVFAPGAELLVAPGSEVRITLTAQVSQAADKTPRWVNKGGMKIVVDKTSETADGSMLGAWLDSNYKTDAKGTFAYSYKVASPAARSESLTFCLLKKDPATLANMVAAHTVVIHVLSDEERASLSKKSGAERDPCAWLDAVDGKVAALVGDANAATRKQNLVELQGRIKSGTLRGRNASFEKVMKAQTELEAAIAKPLAIQSVADLPQLALLRRSVVLDAAEEMKRIDAFIDPSRSLMPDLKGAGGAQLKKLLEIIKAANIAYARELVKSAGDPPDHAAVTDTAINIGVIRKGDALTAAPIRDLSRGAPVRCEVIIRYNMVGGSKPAILMMPGQIAGSLKRRIAAAEGAERDLLTQANTEALAIRDLGRILYDYTNHIQLLRDALARGDKGAPVDRIRDGANGYIQRIAGALPKQ